jgi:hypothetical protein
MSAPDPLEVDGPATATPYRSRRRLVVSVVAAAVVVMALAFAVGGYWYYTRTPTYSLKQISNAIEARNLQLFEKHVDVEAVSKDVVGALVQEAGAATAANARDNPWAAAGAALGQGLVAAMRPGLETQLAQGIRNGVSAPGNDEASSQLRSAFTLNRIEQEARGFADAWITATDPEKRTRTVQVRLKDQGGYWQVMALPNLADILRTEREAAELARLRTKKASADTARVELAKFEVQNALFERRTQGFLTQPVISLAVTNGTGSPVARAYFRGKLATPGRAVPWFEDTFNYEIPGGLEPGENAKWNLEPNMFSGWGSAQAPKGAVLTVTVERLDGPDGKPLFDGSWSEQEQARLDELQKKSSAQP